MPAAPVLVATLLLAGARDTVERGAARDAPADTTHRVTVGGFVDGYLAWDAHRPATLDRAYTTTAARHAEFNVNLAHLETRLAGPRVRGRVAVQFGTSVQANYAGEPRVGTLSGPEVSRYLQEAYVGYRLRDELWIDAGVYFAPFGQESWISRDNPVYTRSLIADFSPYYVSGVRLGWQAARTVQLQAHVLNGWQNVSETNDDKAVAVRVDWSPSDRLTVSYDSFLGNEQPDSVRARLRQFHQVAVRVAPTRRTTLWATFDHGRQPRAGATPQARGDGSASWRGFAVIGQLALTPRVALGGRVEGYSDPEQTIATTGVGPGLRATGGSLNVDLALPARAHWRTELRGLTARDAIFPRRDAPARGRTNGVLVSSLALTF